jgi:hypothetical protein
VGHRPFLATAAVAGAVIAATPLLASSAKNHMANYAGLDDSDPVTPLASDGAASGDQHPDGYPTELPLQGQEKGSGHTDKAQVPVPVPLTPDRSSTQNDSGVTSPTGTPDTARDSVPGNPSVAGTKPASGADGATDTDRIHTSPGASGAIGAGAPLMDAHHDATPGHHASVHLPLSQARATPTKQSHPASTRTGGSTAGTTATPQKPAKKAATIGADTDTDTATGASAGKPTLGVRLNAQKSKPIKAVTSKPLAVTPVQPAAKAMARSALTPELTARAAPVDTSTQKPAAKTAATRTQEPIAKTAPTLTPERSEVHHVSTQKPTQGNPSQSTAVAHQWTGKTIHSTFVLSPGESVASNRMRITMLASGNLVIADEHGTIRWSTHTSGGGNYAVFQTDGNLVVYSKSSEPLWASQTEGHRGSSLVIQKDGNVVILSADGHPVWAAGTQH